MFKMLLILQIAVFSFLLGEGKPPDFFLQNRLPVADKRYSTFAKALELLNKTGAKVCIETGTARYGDQSFTGDGASTVLFSHWAHENQALLYSVDIEEAFLKNAEIACSQYNGWPKLDTKKGEIK